MTFAVGCFLMFMMTCFSKMLSEAERPTGVQTGMFLLAARPVFCLGLTMVMIPLILRNRLVSPLREFMAHPWFAPYARLTFGVFLSHTIFL